METSISLLERLRTPADTAAWARLVDLHTPLLRHWLARFRLQPADQDDLIQEVLGVVVRKVADFRHDGRPGSFRVWLRLIMVNRLRDFWRKQVGRPLATGDSDFLHTLDQLEDPESQLSRLFDQEHDQFVLRRLLELVEPEFRPETWRAFRRQALEGASPAATADELGLSVNAVLIAKSRVLQRLREETRELVDEQPFCD